MSRARPSSRPLRRSLLRLVPVVAAVVAIAVLVVVRTSRGEGAGVLLSGGRSATASSSVEGAAVGAGASLTRVAASTGVAASTRVAASTASRATAASTAAARATVASTAAARATVASTAAARATAASTAAARATAAHATAAPAAGGSTGVVKKGAALWSFAGIDKALPDSGVSWYYTWSSAPVRAAAAQRVEFVPMMWGSGSVTAGALAQAKASGTTLLGFNEPDLGSQANLSVESALALWPRLQATGMRLVSPVVAYGGDTPGGWLDRFMRGAAARGYRVDAVALHWYGGDFGTANAVDQLRRYVTAVHDRYHKPVWVTEYALMRFGPTVTPTPDQQAAFVTASTRMLDALPFVERYAWFSFPTPTEGGLGTGLYTPDGTPTAMGSAYRRA